MKKYGRPTDALRILPALSVFVGRTAAEADALFEELQALISPALAVSYLSKVTGVDLTGLPIDGPMPKRQGEALGGTAIGRSVLDMAAREGLSVRATYERVLPTHGGNMVKGDPVQVVDMMEDWYRSKACDGFMLSMPVEPRSLRDFVELVVPELQRRGLRPRGIAARPCATTWAWPIPSTRSSCLPPTRQVDGQPPARVAFGTVGHGDRRSA